MSSNRISPYEAEWSKLTDSQERLAYITQLSERVAELENDKASFDFQRLVFLHNKKVDDQFRFNPTNAEVIEQEEESDAKIAIRNRILEFLDRPFITMLTGASIAIVSAIITGYLKEFDWRDEYIQSLVLDSKSGEYVDFKPVLEREGYGEVSDYTLAVHGAFVYESKFPWSPMIASAAEAYHSQIPVRDLKQFVKMPVDLGIPKLLDYQKRPIVIYHLSAKPDELRLKIKDDDYSDNYGNLRAYLFKGHISLDDMKLD